MTLEEMRTTIARLLQQQTAHKTHWLRWGFASYAIALLLCAVVLIKVVMTGQDPPTPIIFVVLTYIFLGLAFMTAGKPITFFRPPQS